MKTKKNKAILISFILIIIVSVIISCSDSTEPTDVVFTALPFAGVDWALGYAEGISSDGSIVLGGSAVNTPDDKYMEIPPVYWTNETATILPFPLAQVPGFQRHCAIYDISDNGVMVGDQGIADLSPQAFYYSGDQWHAIIDPATSENAQTATGISVDGNIVVGLSGWGNIEGGYYYNITTDEFTVVTSTFADSADYSDAGTSIFDITADGTIMVGLDGAEKYDSIGVQLPIFFDVAKDTLPTRLPLPTGYVAGVAAGISSDGSTIVGTVYDDEETPYAVYWDSNRQVHFMGTFSPYPGPHQPNTVAQAASDNGDRIVGSSYDIAFIKFKNNDMVSLQDWLEDEGLGSELKDWDLYDASAISDDGHWITGTGVNGYYTQAFKVYIP